MLYKIDFGVLKFKSPLLKPKLNLVITLFKKKINIHINHSVKISLINMTLKWHYKNMFENL